MRFTPEERDRMRAEMLGTYAPPVVMDDDARVGVRSAPVQPSVDPPATDPARSVLIQGFSGSGHGKDNE